MSQLSFDRQGAPLGVPSNMDAMFPSRPDSASHCHCGASYGRSDHCPECGCEQYESDDCGDVYDPANPVHP